MSRMSKARAKPMAGVHPSAEQRYSTEIQEKIGGSGESIRLLQGDQVSKWFGGEIREVPKEMGSGSRENPEPR